MGTGNEKKVRQRVKKTKKKEGREIIGTVRMFPPCHAAAPQCSEPVGGRTRSRTIQGRR